MALPGADGSPLPRTQRERLRGANPTIGDPRGGTDHLGRDLSVADPLGRAHGDPSRCRAADGGRRDDQLIAAQTLRGYYPRAPSTWSLSRSPDIVLFIILYLVIVAEFVWRVGVERQSHVLRDKGRRSSRI